MHPWEPSSWKSKTALQQPSYNDPAKLDRVLQDLSARPPLVTSWEIERLKNSIAQASLGKAFLLQGGDCSESFADCCSDPIERKLKLILQMSLVLIHGLRKPVIRVVESLANMQSHVRRIPRHMTESHCRRIAATVLTGATSIPMLARTVRSDSCKPTIVLWQR